MQERSIVERVEILEKKVDALATLPDRVTRVELQLVQLRDVIRDEFSAIRGGDGQGLSLAGLGDEIRAIRGVGGEGLSLAGLGDEIRAIRGVGGEGLTLAGLRDEMRAEFAAIRGPGAEALTLAALREEIRGGEEETRRYMRMLHEDVIARLAIIQEGRPPRKKR